MTLAEQHKCECPHDSRNNPNPLSAYLPEERKAARHAPGECPGTYGVRQYRRGKQLLWLCSACNLSGDIPVEAEKVGGIDGNDSK